MAWKRNLVESAFDQDGKPRRGASLGIHLLQRDPQALRRHGARAHAQAWAGGAKRARCSIR
jgi:hypothetical protein